jgi:hypothetical protein
MLRHGIEIANAARNQIGGILPGQANVIAYNREHGVEVGMDAAIGNTIRGNSIDHNGWLGIDLGGNGVTSNDPGDVDTGPNNLQNYPVLSAAIAGSATQITGRLDSAPHGTYSIDFYASPAADPSGYGQGARYLGSTLVTTDATGTAVFDVVLPIPGSGGEVVTATATDSDGNTSEFSAALTMVSQEASDGHPSGCRPCAQSDRSTRGSGGFAAQRGLGPRVAIVLGRDLGQHAGHHDGGCRPGDGGSAV